MEVKTNYCDFFEGTEKLLEIWFGASRTENSSVNCDLRSVPRLVIFVVIFIPYLIERLILDLLWVYSSRIDNY